MIESVRNHMARILRTLKPDQFQRTVNHSEAGPLTLEKLLTNITPNYSRSAGRINGTIA